MRAKVTALRAHSVEVDCDGGTQMGIRWEEVNAEIRDSLMVGDQVEVSYIATRSSGLWKVTKKVR